MAFVAMPTPRVTVLVACFNTAPYLVATLESVRTQSFEDFEVIMVDDGSTDGTWPIMCQFAAADRRFKATQMPQNAGVVAARNAGLARASGTYVAPLDGDDIWTPDALAHRLELADKYPQADVIATEFAWFEDQTPTPPYAGRVGMGPRAKVAFAQSFATGEPSYMPQPFEQMATLHFAWTGAMLIRRAALTAAGNFDASFAGPEDTLLWLRLALRGAFVFSPKVTAFYRQRPGSLVTTYKGPKELHYLSVLERIRADGLTRAQHHNVRHLQAQSHHIASLHFRLASQTTTALQHAWLALKHGPLSSSIWKNLMSTWLEHMQRRMKS